jgi:hypothetical protein
MFISRNTTIRMVLDDQKNFPAVYQAFYRTMQACLDTDTEIPAYIRRYISGTDPLEFTDPDNGFRFLEDKILFPAEEGSGPKAIRLAHGSFACEGAEMESLPEQKLYASLRSMQACISFTHTWLTAVLKEGPCSIAREERLKQCYGPGWNYWDMYGVPVEYVRGVAESGVPLWLEDALGSVHDCRNAEIAEGFARRRGRVLVDPADWHGWMAAEQASGRPFPVEKDFIPQLWKLHVPVYRMDTDIPELYEEPGIVFESTEFSCWPADLDYALWADYGMLFFRSALDILAGQELDKQNAAYPEEEPPER